MTKTETLNRLRTLAAASRKAAGQPFNAPVEVGLRNENVTCTHDDGPCSTLTGDDWSDDLAYYLTLRQAAALLAEHGQGHVVHLYVSSLGWDGQLESVTVGWTGTGTAPARLVNIDGRTL